MRFLVLSVDVNIICIMPLHVMSYHAVSHHSHYIYIYQKNRRCQCAMHRGLLVRRCCCSTAHTGQDLPFEMKYDSACACICVKVLQRFSAHTVERVPFCRHCIRTFLLTSWNASKREAGHSCAQKLLHIFTQSFRVPCGCSFCLFDLIYDVPLAPAPAYPFGSSCLLQKGHSHVKQESCLCNVHQFRLSLASTSCFHVK